MRPGVPRVPATDEALDRLRRSIAGHGSAVIAFSAGVDSTLVLAVATRELGARAVGVFGVSPSVPEGEREEALALAADLGAELLLRPTHELGDPRYVANAGDRCRYCKSELFAVCAAVAAERGLAVILDGTQADDLHEIRPGLAAGRAAGVRSPLAECGLGKEQVRTLAREVGLPNWDKPALACLASRLPQGTTVTAERLAAVDAVERALRGSGFRQVRARHLGSDVLLQVDAERVDDLRAVMDRPDVLHAVRAAGFARALVDPAGYRRGATLPAEPAP